MCLWHALEFVCKSAIGTSLSKSDVRQVYCSFGDEPLPSWCMKQSSRGGIWRVKISTAFKTIITSACHSNEGRWWWYIPVWFILLKCCYRSDRRVQKCGLWDVTGYVNFPTSRVCVLPGRKKRINITLCCLAAEKNSKHIYSECKGWQANEMRLLDAAETWSRNVDR